MNELHCRRHPQPHCAQCSLSMENILVFYLNRIRSFFCFHVKCIACWICIYVVSHFNSLNRLLSFISICVAHCIFHHFIGTQSFTNAKIIIIMIKSFVSSSFHPKLIDRSGVCCKWHVMHWCAMCASSHHSFHPCTHNASDAGAAAADEMRSH